VRFVRGENLNIDELKALTKEDIPRLSKNLNAADILFLIQTLNKKDDALRYHAFLLLQLSSRESLLVYNYWVDLERKLESSNSYQRSIGAMLIAENVRWDKEDRFSKAISKYLSCCNDEKFITARQAIQGLAVILKATDKFDAEIGQSLSNFRSSQYKDNQQKLVNKDVVNILKVLENKKKQPK
jgi:hypothetical protein